MKARTRIPCHHRKGLMTLQSRVSHLRQVCVRSAWPLHQLCIRRMHVQYKLYFVEVVYLYISTELQVRRLGILSTCALINLKKTCLLLHLIEYIVRV